MKHLITIFLTLLFASLSAIGQGYQDVIEYNPPQQRTKQHAPSKSVRPDTLGQGNDRIEKPIERLDYDKLYDPEVLKSRGHIYVVDENGRPIVDSEHARIFQRSNETIDRIDEGLDEAAYKAQLQYINKIQSKADILIHLAGDCLRCAQSLPPAIVDQYDENTGEYTYSFGDFPKEKADEVKMQVEKLLNRMKEEFLQVDKSTANEIYKEIKEQNIGELEWGIIEEAYNQAELKRRPQ